MIRTIYYLFITFAFLSCCERDIKMQLSLISDIEAMGDTMPEIAMMQLDSIRTQFEKGNEYMQKKMALLDIRLRDKAYLTHTSSKEMKEICNYFEEKGTAEEIQEAYYYMGSVYRDLNDYPNAITFFLKSKSIAESNSNIDTILWENACSQLAGLYNQQYNYTEALRISLQELEIAKRINHDDSHTYMYVAECYWDLMDTINSLKYTKIALDRINDKINKKNADVIAKAMEIYAYLGCNNEASQCFKRLQLLPKDEIPYNYLISLSIYYRKCVSPDSAATVMQELYDKSINIEGKYDASYWLTLYYASKGEYKTATQYAIKFIYANKDIIEKRNFEHTTNANNFFKYQRDKEEETRIIQQAANDRFHLMSGISVSLIFITIVLSFYYYRKKQMVEKILSTERYIKNANELIEQKENEIVKKKRELELLSTTNDKLSEQLLKAQDDFKMLVAQNRELTKLTLMENLSINAGEIIEKCKRTIKGKYSLNDEEWKELLGAIDKLYPEFTYEVQAKFKRIKEPMLRVCYLVKIGLSNPEIANITGYPPQTVWDRVKKVRNTLNL